MRLGCPLVGQQTGRACVVVDIAAGYSEFMALNVKVQAAHLFQGFVGHVQFVGDFDCRFFADLGDLGGKERCAAATAASDISLVLYLDLIDPIIAPKVAYDAFAKGSLNLFTNEFSTNIVVGFTG